MSAQVLVTDERYRPHPEGMKVGKYRNLKYRTSKTLHIIRPGGVLTLCGRRGAFVLVKGGFRPELATCATCRRSFPVRIPVARLGRGTVFAIASSTQTDMAYVVALLDDGRGVCSCPAQSSCWHISEARRSNEGKRNG